MKTVVVVLLNVSFGLFFPYQASAQVCPPRPGYTVLTDTNWNDPPNFTGGQLLNGPAAEALCNADSSCTHWNSFGYYRFGGANGPTVKNYYMYQGLCTYVKGSATACPALAGYIWQLDTDYFDSLVNIDQHMDITIGMDRCDNNSTCAGMNWLPSSSTPYGFTKTTVSPPSPSAGSCLYSKTGFTEHSPPPSPAPPSPEPPSPEPPSPPAPPSPEPPSPEPPSPEPPSPEPPSPPAPPSPAPPSPMPPSPAPPTVCPPRPGYTELTDTNWNDPPNFTGGQLLNGPAAEALCNADSSCTHWNSFGYYRFGGANGPTVKNYYMYQGLCTYVKGSATACPALAGYIWQLDTDYFDSLVNIDQHMDITIGMDRCDNNSTCAGMNWLPSSSTPYGFTKTTVSPPSPSAGSCLYSKTGFTEHSPPPSPAPPSPEPPSPEPPSPPAPPSPEPPSPEPPSPEPPSPEPPSPPAPPSPAPPSPMPPSPAPPTVCPPRPGYTELTDTNWNDPPNFTGGQLLNGPAAEALCNADSSCTHWNSFGYYRFGGANGPTVKNYYMYQGLCTYVKGSATACPALAGYIWQLDTDYFDSLVNIDQHMDITIGKDRCDNNSTCAGMNWLPSRSTPYGFTKTTVSPPSPSAGSCLYSKTGFTEHSPPPSPAPPSPEPPSPEPPSPEPPSPAPPSPEPPSPPAPPSPAPPSPMPPSPAPPTVCPPRPGYTELTDTNWNDPPNFTGGQLLNGPAAEALCNADSSCTHWNSFGYYRFGGANGPTVKNYYMYQGLCTYVKGSATACPALAGYIWQLDTDYYDSLVNIDQHMDITIGKDRCDNNSTCAGMNWLPSR
ncbi:hypothetical protein HYH02_010487 [Chlamydomonas schloesseri]|uniref:Uncharacterized protein n=1 Tax=Chlamydomonas schloesseri TaxID=2026947 RepID=A0A835W587_9CHLO|nr:hypothetical protein HYH02_010487 [Chlamydomonas schloesseri]|eukprot:KAG2439855.1 hypothetical protein HYH02_010487 [Chlamydomonas schloesseri]